MGKFVKIWKDGETIEVHPSVVENHKQLGWKVVGEVAIEEAPAESTSEPAAEGKPRRRSRKKKNKSAEGEKAE